MNINGRWESDGFTAAETYLTKEKKVCLGTCLTPPSFVSLHLLGGTIGFVSCAIKSSELVSSSRRESPNYIHTCTDIYVHAPPRRMTKLRRRRRRLCPPRRRRRRRRRHRRRRRSSSSKSLVFVTFSNLRETTSGAHECLINRLRPVPGSVCLWLL